MQFSPTFTLQNKLTYSHDFYLFDVYLKPNFKSNTEGLSQHTPVFWNEMINHLCKHTCHTKTIFPVYHTMTI